MIRTERLHIRPLNYYELVSRVYSFSGMITNEEEQENVIEYTLKPMKKAPEELHRFYTFWVAEHNGEEVLECGFICPPTEHNVVEVWYNTKEKYRCKGFATEAVMGLVRLSEAYDNIKFVCASVDKDNKASQRVLIKSGFYYLSDLKNGMMVFNKQIKN